MGIFNILKNKASGSILRISGIVKMTKIWHFFELFNFQPMLDNYKIRTRTNFENRESLDPHLMMRLILKSLFLAPTDFTVAISNIT